jgi:hypothetical protein
MAERRFETVPWPYLPLTAHAMRRFAERVDGVTFRTDGPDVLSLLAAQRAGRVDLGKLAERMMTPAVRLVCAMGRGRVKVEGANLYVTDGFVITAIVHAPARIPGAHTNQHTLGIKKRRDRHAYRRAPLHECIDESNSY